MQGKILIVDDLATNRIILKVKLNAAYYDTTMAASAAEALMRARQDLPTLILLDLVLPDMSGIEVCRRLRNDPATSHIPIVIITASNDRQSRIEALAAGADEFLVKPLNEVILLARIRSLLRAHQTETEMRLRSETWGSLDLAETTPAFDQPALIGLVAEDAAAAIGWQRALAPHLSATMRVLSPSQALSPPAGQPVPDCFIISARLGRVTGAGMRLVADLRSRDCTRHAAIALVLDDLDTANAAMALDLGANDLMTQPWDPEETALRLSLHLARKRRADQLRAAVRDGLRLSVIDPLTGLFNRRFGLAHLDRMFARAEAEGRTLGVMVLDLDRFKAINDTHGHTAGDIVLEAVAAVLRDTLRPSDLIARIGGEEFMIVLPDTTPNDAMQVAQRLCGAIARRRVPIPPHEPMRVLAGVDDVTAAGAVDGLGSGLPEISLTASVGLAVALPIPAPRTEHDTMNRQSGRSGRQLLDAADQALLAAKAEGRNQVTMASAA